MEIRSKHFKVKALEENSDFQFDGYASTYGNEDRDGDIIEKGCFSDSLKNKTVYPMCFNHDLSTVIGKVDLTDDEKGVFAKGTFNQNDDVAEKYYDLVKMGAIDSMSIHFFVKDYEPVDSTKPYGGWRIKKADIIEVSLVTVPANTEALISTVKSQSEVDEKLIRQIVREEVVKGVSDALIFYDKKKDLIKKINNVKGE